MDNYQGPGLYRHYKGGLYLARGLAVAEADHEVVVMYEPVARAARSSMAIDFAHPALMWVRPLDDFNAEVEVRTHGDGTVTRPRFEMVSS